jgi:hypothetical protein
LVTTTADYAPGEESIDGSLRAAVEWANSHEGLNRITFNLDESDAGYQTKNADSWWRFQTKATLTITEAVIIDGFSQEGASRNTSLGEINAVLKIELDGRQAGNATGLVIEGGGSTVQGLAVHSFHGDNIELRGGSGNHIAGNFVGTDATGMLAPSGWPDLSPAGRVGPYGIEVTGSDNNWIGTDGDGNDDVAERNLISGHNWGVVLRNAFHNVVAGNLIGTDKTGLSRLPNWTGIGLLDGATSNRIGTTFENAGSEVERNIISGNESGIYLGAGGIDNSAIDTVVAGNYIGLNVKGGALANGHVGVAVMMGAHDNTIGRNTIAHNKTAGVVAVDLRAHVEGNRFLENKIYSNGGLGIDLLGIGIKWGRTTNEAPRVGRRLPRHGSCRRCARWRVGRLGRPDRSQSRARDHGL